MTTDKDSIYFQQANELVNEANQLIKKANNKIKLWFTSIVSGYTAEELYTEAIEKLTRSFKFIQNSKKLSKSNIYSYFKSIHRRKSQIFWCRENVGKYRRCQCSD